MPATGRPYLLTAPSDPVTDAPPRPDFAAPRRAAAAASVLALTLPFALAPTLVRSAPEATVRVQAVAVRSALLADDAFDRPSSGEVDAGAVDVLAGRTVLRASRDAVRVVPAEALTRTPAAPARAQTRERRPGWKKKTQSTNRWVRPGNGRFTSGFKFRWGRWHKGIDLAAPMGSPIVAAADGVVIYVGPASGFGRLVLVRHSGTLVTAYGHMSAYRTHVGAHVRAGELIALVGSAGHSTGPHLHFEVRINGVQVNPVPFLAKHHVFV